MHERVYNIDCNKDLLNGYEINNFQQIWFFLAQRNKGLPSTGFEPMQLNITKLFYIQTKLKIYIGKEISSLIIKYHNMTGFDNINLPIEYTCGGMVPNDFPL